MSLSFSDPDIQRSPFAAYAELRRDGPVFWDEAGQTHVVLGYDELRAVTADPATFSSMTGQLLVKDAPYQDEVDAIFREHGILPTNTLVVADPPLHSFHRAHVDKVFSISRVKKMQDYLTTVVNELIDGVIDRDAIEFTSEFATRVPAYVIADQLGLPRSRFADFRRWTDAVMIENDPRNTREVQLELTRTICELQRYLLDKAKEYRRTPGDNILSDLVTAGDSDERALSDREIVSMVVQILVAGIDTTTSAMGSALYRMIATPGLEDRLRADASLIGNFIEEILRFDSPIQALWRRATRDVVLGGKQIREGEIIVVRFGAGNHDPAHFPDPDRLDPARRNARNHLAFGSGPHFCVGNQLARGELRTSFAILLDRMKNFRLARGEGGVAFAATYVAYGVTRLEIAFDRNL